MGVLACDRNNCENIMCDYASPVFGYICYECLDGLRNGPRVNIQDYMDSVKAEVVVVVVVVNDVSWVHVVDTEFKSRYDE